MSQTNNYTVKNVLLETGFEYDQKEVIRTKTDLFSVEIENNTIMANHIGTWKYKFLIDSFKIGKRGTPSNKPAIAV